MNRIRVRSVFLWGVFWVGMVAEIRAHGPQVQVTVDNQKITTRAMLADGPYWTSLTEPKTAYVMPVLAFNDVWYSRPNTALTAAGTPVFYSGPGVAYGFDQADGGGQDFAEGSTLSLVVRDLKAWNGSSFMASDGVQLEAFRGAPANPSAVARTAATGEGRLPVATIASGYGADGKEAHSTVRYRFLGDGISPTVPPADGIFLLSLGLISDQLGLIASDPFYFVMHKNATETDIHAAVNSLGIDPRRVQYVPEPSSLGMLFVAALLAGAGRRRAMLQTQRV